MNIFKRLFTLVKSNINYAISKAENPSKMLEQLIIDMNSKLKEAKQQVAVSIVDEKKLYKSYIEYKSQVDEWHNRAESAVMNSNDQLASESLVKKAQYENLMNQYYIQWNKQRDIVNKLKSSLNILHSKIEEASRKKNLLISRHKRAEAQSKINSVLSNMNDSSAFDSFSRLEDKVSEIESMADVENELNNLGSFSNDYHSSNIKIGATDSNINSKLIELKKKLKK